MGGRADVVGRQLTRAHPTCLPCLQTKWDARASHFVCPAPLPPSSLLPPIPPVPPRANEVGRQLTKYMGFFWRALVHTTVLKSLLSCFLGNPFVMPTVHVTPSLKPDSRLAEEAAAVCLSPACPFVGVFPLNNPSTPRAVQVDSLIKIVSLK